MIRESLPTAWGSISGLLFFFKSETYLNFCNVSNSKTSENVHDNKMADKHHGHQDNEEIKFISTKKRLVYLGQITRVELSSHKGKRLRNRLQIDENKKKLLQSRRVVSLKTRLSKILLEIVSLNSLHILTYPHFQFYTLYFS